MKMLILNTKENNSEGIESVEDKAISTFKGGKFISKQDLDSLTPSQQLI